MSMSTAGALTFKWPSTCGAQRLSTAFKEASPFPHVVLTDTLEGSPEDALAAWPGPDWPYWKRFRDAYQAGKMFCAGIDRIPEPWAGLIRQLSGPSFLVQLEALTGIRGLIPDPYLEGGGLHCSGLGGVLAPHTDFHLYRRLGLYRRINLLLYLNPAWQEENGGSLELWEKGADAPARMVVPRWGSCVIFQTDDRSVHGFSNPVTEASAPPAAASAEALHWRRSMALYYYTAEETTDYSGDTTTYWRRHGVLSGVRRLRLGLYKSLIFGARGLACLAHRINPNLQGKSRPRDRGTPIF